MIPRTLTASPLVTTKRPQTRAARLAEQVRFRTQCRSNRRELLGPRTSVKAVTPRLRCTLALVLGLIAAAAAPVAGVPAIAAGAVAAGLGGWALARRPTGSIEFGLAVGGVVLGLAGAGLGAAVLLADDGANTSGPKLSFVDGIATATPDDVRPPQKDIARPLPCRVEIDALRAAVTVTNSLDQPADYTIIVVWEENDVELARNTVVINAVPPSLSRQREAFAAGTGSSITTCRALRVDRALSAGG